MKPIPEIVGKGTAATLMVDGKPFRMLAGEVHNSSASDLEYMEKHVWPAYERLHANTVIAPVYWECMEPEEGVFDDTLTDGLIHQARAHGMKLVLLWFGLWKNSGSTYVPEWVKTDRERFWYVQARDGRMPAFFGSANCVISPLCQAAVDADARAFAHLMRHLKEVDAERTVIMVQVENEMGILGSDRDYSPEAEKAYAQEIPQALTEKGYGRGTWKDVFWDRAPERFMAWHYASAVERICRAGKDEYALPMYVNTWLEEAAWVPGKYPSGGPQYRNHDLWSIAAPDVDIYAPDIYVTDFQGVCGSYATEDNPLFIPETRMNAAYFLYALGRYQAMCFAPFGAEDAFADHADMDPETARALGLSEDFFTSQARAGQALACAYALVPGMESQIRKAASEGRMHGFMHVQAKEETIHLSGADAQISYDGQESAGGMILELAEYEYVVLAMNCSLRFEAKEHGVSLDVLTKEEGRYDNGVWKRGRILNGDERYRNRFGAVPELIRFRLLPYKN